MRGERPRSRTRNLPVLAQAWRDPPDIGILRPEGDQDWGAPQRTRAHFGSPIIASLPPALNHDYAGGYWHLQVSRHRDRAVHASDAADQGGIAWSGGAESVPGGSGSGVG